jgi:hypothetical protein
MQTNLAIANGFRNSICAWKSSVAVATLETMNTADTRYRNILALLRGYEHDARFADAAGISTSYLSQVKNRTRNLGERAARNIEANLKLETFSLDSPDFKTDRELSGTDRYATDLEAANHEAALRFMDPGADARTESRALSARRLARKGQNPDADKAKMELIRELIGKDMTIDQINGVHRFLEYMTH